MFDALRERTLKGAATKSFNSGLKACAEMAMNSWLTTLMIAKTLISPEMIKIELRVASVGTEMAGDKLFHFLLSRSSPAKIDLFQTLFDPGVDGNGSEKI